MIKTRSERNAGFTLVEVMVALVIAGLSLAAVAASVSQMVDAGLAMRERTYASWIAQNKIAELRLANVVPEVSSTSGEIEYAARDWAWRSTMTTSVWKPSAPGSSPRPPPAWPSIGFPGMSRGRFWPPPQPSYNSSRLSRIPVTHNCGRWGLGYWH